MQRFGVIVFEVLEVLLAWKVRWEAETHSGLID